MAKKMLTRQDVEAKLPVQIALVEMGRTTNDPYTFSCLVDTRHGEWTVTGRNVLYLKSGCPKCWDVRRRLMRKHIWRVSGYN